MKITIIFDLKQNFKEIVYYLNFTLIKKNKITLAIRHFNCILHLHHIGIKIIVMQAANNATHVIKFVPTICVLHFTFECVMLT